MFVYFIINNSGISSPSPGPEPAESLSGPLAPGSLAVSMEFSKTHKKPAPINGRAF